METVSPPELRYRNHKYGRSIDILQMRNGELDIDLQNSKMETGEWTAVAFGPDMVRLSIIGYGN